MTKLNGFMRVQPQFYTIDDEVEIGYLTDCTCFETLRKAYNTAFRLLEHDDFLIVQWKDDDVVAVYDGPKMSSGRADLLAKTREGIMKEFGLWEQPQ